MSFIPVGRVAATGNSSAQQYYSFIDNTPLKGTSYYRLQPTDRDGKFTYSQVVAVSISNPGMLFAIYPNPVKEAITLVVSMDKKQESLYSIYDQAGKKMVSNTVSLNESVNTITLPVGSLPAGMYVIQLKTDAGFRQSQFMKQR